VRTRPAPLKAQLRTIAGRSDPDRVALGASLLRQAMQELERLRRVRGAILVGHQLGAPQYVDTAKDHEVCVPVRVTNPGTTS
jgi:hypothetical protein